MLPVDAGLAATPSRILFVTTAPPDGLAGGVKAMHRPAEPLAGLGLSARVLAPRGRPVCFRSRAVGETTTALRGRPLLVFGEDMDEAHHQALSRPCRRALCCQTPRCLLQDRLGTRSLAEAGFDQVSAAGRTIQAFLAEVRGCPGVMLVEPPIEPTLVRPAAKRLCIALMPGQAARAGCLDPRRLPPPSRFGRRALGDDRRPPRGGGGGYPCRRGGGLGVGPPRGAGDGGTLEAMAGGCAVVGFHGSGGLECAGAEKGRWFWSDEPLACADALADVVRRIERGDQAVAAMIAAGRSTAAGYAPVRVARQLRACCGGTGACTS